MNLKDYDAVIVNSSGGKDSQTALRQVFLMAEAQGYPLAWVFVSHQDLGRMEWKQTKELAKIQAEHYGLRCIVTQYQNKNGQTPELLDYVRKRGMWPDSGNRYCTSEFKRGPGGRAITYVATMARDCKGKAMVRILNVYGFRAEESPARAKKHVLARNGRQTRGNQIVDDWCPILHWTTAQVWTDIKASGVPHHPAYDIGMPRLSCVFCIFAPRSALILAGRYNPALLQEYVDLEKEIDHTFRQKQSLLEIQQAIASGEQAGKMDGNWNM